MMGAGGETPPTARPPQTAGAMFQDAGTNALRERTVGQPQASMSAPRDSFELSNMADCC